MTATESANLWSAIHPGEVLAFVSSRPIPEPPPAWKVVAVVCRPGARPLTPLVEAQSQLQAAAQDHLRTWATQKVRSRVRQHLLGYERSPYATASILQALDGLSDLHDGPTAIVVDHLEHADPLTLTALRQLVERRGGFRPALVLGFGETPGGGLATALLQAAERHGHVVHDEGQPEEAEAEALPALAGAVLLSLQAAACIGPRFHIDMVAKLLDRSTAEVLRDLQIAANEGVSLEDVGGGGFAMDEAVAAQLRNSTFPTLLREWSALLGNLQAPQAADPEDADLGEIMHAAHNAAMSGATDRALALAQDALALASDASDIERAAIHRFTAEVLWLGAGSKGIYSLEGALEEALAALELLADAAPEERAATRELVAGILYDRGDAAATERALDELTEAIREYREAGDPRAAARLLNDQAAVWVRLGDPVRAAHLLDESRQVFTRPPAEQTTTDHHELAETLLLLARLPLHVQARNGAERQALEAALEHARDAAKIYEHLDHRRGLGRALETVGRLQVLLDDLEAAEKSLVSALELQRDLGDVIGLAQTTEALARLTARAGQYPAAFRLIAQSAALNARKGSRVGTRYLRRTFEELVSAMDPADREAHQEPLSQLARQLSTLPTGL